MLLMNVKISFKQFIVLFLFQFIFLIQGFSQLYPVPLDQRVNDVERIIIGKVIEKTAYRDASQSNIYTLNTIQVTAYLKGFVNNKQIAFITSGGRIGPDKEVTFPGVELTVGQEVLLLLGNDENVLDHKLLRLRRPELMQCQSTFGVQGVFKYQKGKYYDRIAEQPMTESELVERVENLTRQQAKTSKGEIFTARNYKGDSGDIQKTILSLNDGAGSSPTSFKSGTIMADNELVITGTGFGASVGTIAFNDADTGGSSDIIVPTETMNSDIISWSDTQIRVKIPTEAGTGTVTVFTSDGANAGSSPITIDYGINNVSSDFYNWAEDNRNRLKLLDLNGMGGYTYKYNNNHPNAANSFHSNTAARAAFERAVESWRCNTFVNFDVDDSGTSEGYEGDNGSIITFADLPGGTLGVTTSRYTALGGGPCDQENTLWYVKEMDIRFDNTLISGYSWNYGPGTTANNQFDFETTALHELGHAHGLGHVISSGQVMHYVSFNGFENRTLSAADIQAGSFKVSVSTQSNCVSSIDPMTAVPVGDCSILPVELVRFDAREAGDKIDLYWKTNTEHNSDYFVVERSADSKSFSEIGRVGAAGTSFTPNEYAILDEKPLEGINYYRLVQADFNGHKEYSEIKSVEFIKTTESKIEIFPNPVSSNVLFVDISNLGANLKSLKIHDATGRVFNLIDTNLESEDQMLNLDLKTLPKGIFWLTIETDNGDQISDRFIRQ